MKTLTDHKLNDANAQLNVRAIDEPGKGGACHHYEIKGFDLQRNPSTPPLCLGEESVHLIFQNGSPQEVGTNGVTQEAVLTVLIDRLRGFQSGQFACRENAIVLTHLEEALMWLQKRTRDRMARGVEGQPVP